MSSPATPGTRSARKTQIGFVSSRSGDKTVKVTVAFKKPHPLYQKVVNRQTVLHVHDEKNETKVGDKVEIMESRPISRLKRWRVIRVIEASVIASAAVTENDVAETVPTKTTQANTPAQ